jgi:integrase/recombinase XerC
VRSHHTIAPDVAAEIGRWLGYLNAERRMSPKTLEAYRRPAIWAAHRACANWRR